jgi:hypothetical protein
MDTHFFSGPFFAGGFFSGATAPLPQPPGNAVVGGPAQPPLFLPIAATGRLVCGAAQLDGYIDVNWNDQNLLHLLMISA